MSAVYHRDTKPPTCSINIGSTKSTTSGYYYTPAKFNLTSPELNSISYGMNNTASKTYNGKKTITVNSDGNNGIHGYVKDKAGNEGKCDKSATTTKKYTITFNGNGGTPNPKTKAVYWGDKIGSLASISRYGYNLSGWFNANTGGSVVNASTIMPRRNVTYYARWTPKKVTVTFNCNGGSGGGSQTFTYGASNQKFGKTCSRSGYTIDGWKLNKNGSSRDYATNSGVSNDWINSKSPSVTVYAHWKAIPKYTVKVVAGDGTQSVSLDGSTSSLTKTVYGGTKIKIGATAKKYYQFDSWSNGDKTASTEVIVNSDLTLTATSRTNKIRVFYHCNGGKLIPAEMQSCPDIADCGPKECLWPQRKACRDPKTNDGVCWITGTNDYKSDRWASEGLRNHGGKRDSTIYMIKGKKDPNRCWTIKETGVILHEQSTFSTGLVLLKHCGGSYAKDLETKDVNLTLLAGYGNTNCEKKKYTK